MKKIYWSLKKRFYLLNKTPKVVERLGAKWFLDPTDWLQLRLLINKPFENEQLQYFKNICRENNISTFFDCGANFGLYSVLIAKEFPHIKTHSFEPVSNTRSLLEKNIILNDLSDHIFIEPFALSNENTTMDIMIDTKALGISSLSPDAKRNYDKKEKIQLKIFDDEFELSNQNLAFKIDVEGHEIAAIDGMKNTFKNNKCVIQIETRPENRQGVITFFEKLGYAHLNEITEDLFFSN